MVFYGAKNLPKSLTYVADLTQNAGFSINYHFPFSKFISGIDLNSDGYPEIGIINTAPYSAPIGQIDIFWGGKNNGNIDTYNMNPTQGIILQTPNLNSTLTDDIRYFADLVSDTNGDGLGELLVGSPAYNNNTGMARLVLGRANFTEVNLSFTNDTKTINIYGEQPGDKLGFSVAYVGDVNGDKFGDFVVCAPFAYSGAGACYVLYGRRNFPSEIYLQDLTANDGFKIIGSSNTTQLGDQVVRYGDVDNDGFDDFGILVKDENAIYIIYGGNRTLITEEKLEKFITKTASNSKTHTQIPSSSLTPFQTLTKPHEVNTDSKTISKSVNITDSISVSHTLDRSFSVAMNDTIIKNMTALESKKPLPDNIFPEEVASTITEINAYANIARVLALNPTSVSQGGRIDSMKKMLSCGGAKEEMFDSVANPSGASIDYFGQANTAALVLFTDIGILVGSVLTALALKRIRPEANNNHPSIIAGVPLMLVLEPFSKAATVMALYGSALAQSISAVASGIKIVSIIGLSYKIFKNFDAKIDTVVTKFKCSSITFTDERWVSPEGSKFTENFEYFFEGYKESMKYFMPIEVTINILTGITGRISSPQGSCNGALYASTSVYSVYTVVLIIARPYTSMVENVFSIVVATGLTIPQLIKSLQAMDFVAEDNETLNQIKDTLPTITEVLVLTKTVYDVADMGKKFITDVVPPQKSIPSTSGGHTVLNVPTANSQVATANSPVSADVAIVVPLLATDASLPHTGWAPRGKQVFNPLAGSLKSLIIDDDDL
jgi:hypothetical protein